MTDRRGVLFDVDGTLVDTNYLHITAWAEALRANGHRVAMAELHRYIGQGSDRFVTSVLGHDDEDVRRAHASFYRPWLERLTVLDRAPELIEAVHALGLAVVLASSASQDELARMRAELDVDHLLDAATSKADVATSKPAPDVFAAAVEQAGLDPAASLVVGDTVWDVESAGRCGLRCVALLSGGVCEAALREAGALAVYRDPAHLLAELDRSPIGELARG